MTETEAADGSVPKRAKGEITLQAFITYVFVLLVVPALAAVVAFSYYENERNLLVLSDRFIDRARDDAIQMSNELILPVAGTLRLLAETAKASPEFFRAESSRDTLFAALTSVRQIDAVYISFEDGYHRVVTRVDDDRRRNDEKIPPSANWHSSYVDAHGPGVRRQRHRTFFDVWPHEVGGYDVDTDLDVRTLPHYMAAKARGRLAIADPSINPDTGYPIVAVGYPIGTGTAFTGFAAANITMGDLSRFLSEKRASPNSISLIYDRLGNVIAHSNKVTAQRRTGGNVEFAKLSDLTVHGIADAIRERGLRKSDRFTFVGGNPARELTALFSPFQAGPETNWEVLILTPTDDFIGELKAANRQLIGLLIGLAILESTLIYFMARRVARPIEHVAAQIRRVRSLAIEAPGSQRSRIHEIADLQGAMSLLHNALRSFSVFVPVDIVRELIVSGRPMAPSGETRFMTVFFCDLENFSTVAETLSPEDLSRQITTYFERVTGAIAQDGGTVDKFIGDSVMAFWGAPVSRDDHVWLGCRAARRANHRMRALNDQWQADGRPTMRLRIGLHCDSVVVGNIGSAERLSYTVMGDGVNIASRLEGLNKQFGTEICISDGVHRQVADRVLVRPIRRVSVKGRTAPILVYELLGCPGETDPELLPRPGDADLARLTQAAFALFDDGRFGEAAVAYERVLEAFPDDRLARTMAADARQGGNN